MWAEKGGLVPDPESTRLVVSLSVTPLPQPGPLSVCLTQYRRPGPDSATTDAKAVGLYAQAGRAQAAAQKRGFDDAVMLGPDGFVAEFSGSNIFIVKDGVALTPKVNGTFLNGITRQRVLQLLRDDGVQAIETTLTRQDILEADEVFSTGNYGKVLPITRVEDRHFQTGHVYRRARTLYFEFARTQPIG
jgi:branched-chain amino acid aminotransferase